jgi:F-type H+-transporting ATPase subunit b
MKLALDENNTLTQSTDEQAETTDNHTTEATTAHEETTPGGLAGGAQALGLDGKLLAAQIVNFIILVLILRKFLYGPLLNLLEQRRVAIEESQRKAKEMEQRFTDFETEHKQRIQESKEEAKRILESARTTAATLQAESVIQTQKQADQMIERAKLEIDQERDKAMEEIQHDISGLVVAATKKVLGKTITADINEALVKKAVDEVKQ